MLKPGSETVLRQQPDIIVDRGEAVVRRRIGRAGIPKWAVRACISASRIRRYDLARRRYAALTDLDPTRVLSP
jgi:hypothetical protein